MYEREIRRLKIKVLNWWFADLFGDSRGKNAYKQMQLTIVKHRKDSEINRLKGRMLTISYACYPIKLYFGANSSVKLNAKMDCLLEIQDNSKYGICLILCTVTISCTI